MIDSYNNIRKGGISCSRKNRPQIYEPYFFAFSPSFLVSGCGGINFNLWPDRTKPLKERVLEGKAEGKVAIIPITGFISESPRRELIGKEPSLVQEVVAQLRLAEKDPEVKAVLLKVASPGGTVTASDLLYHEIMAFKERKKAKIIVMMMSTAASGGYYVSLPADVIYAHPTTITGSIGVIFLRPTVTTLMDKVGVTVEINKTGKNKDMGSPYRTASPEEKGDLCRIDRQDGETVSNPGFPTSEN